jgi:hypothetical protein
MTSTNAQLFERAQRVIPGGVNSPVRAFRAVGGTPRFIARAQGPYIFDAEGTRYIDYLGSWGPMILGHRPPSVMDAVQQAVGRGTSFGTPGAGEVELAELIVDRTPVQQVRLGSRSNRALLKASFATNHIIRGDQGLIDLNPILKAFTGPSPDGQSTRSIILTISGIAPNERIVRRIDSEHLALSGRQVGQLEAVEYRAFIKTSDPNMINVPVDASAPLASTGEPATAEAPERTMWIAVVLAILSCAALGALVYSFVGRVRFKSGARKAPEKGRK